MVRRKKAYQYNIQEKSCTFDEYLKSNDVKCCYFHKLQEGWNIESTECNMKMNEAYVP